MKAIGKILLAALSYVVGNIVAGVLTTALHLPQASAPPGTTSDSLFRGMVLFSPLLIVGAVALASGLGGKFAVRFVALFLLIYVTIGVNTVIEAKVFTTLIAAAAGTMFIHYILPSAFCAATLAALFGSRQTVPALPHFSAGRWTWRIVAAWLAFPVIYWTFGMCVAPIVIGYYRTGVQGLCIPPAHVILQIQLLRSLLFLIASLPAILLWTKSRRSLFISLGIAHAVMVGIYGLAQAYWLPNVLRVAHSIEITADSFAYAGVLVLLFTKAAEAREVLRTKAVANAQ